MISKAKLWLRDKGICGICRQSVSMDDANRDHIIPKSCGGSDAADNLQIAHKVCNSARNNQPLPGQVLPDPCVRRKRRKNPRSGAPLMRDGRDAYGAF